MALFLTISVPAVAEEKASEGNIALHRFYGAPHGDRGFATINVLVSEDKIIDLTLDEFQFLESGEGVVGVPNSEGVFGKGIKEGMTLGSKMENDEVYSKMMAEFAGSKVTIADNFNAIIDFVKGKTFEEVQKVIDESEPGQPIDAVSGATLADTAGYLNAILEAAKSDFNVVYGNAENPEEVVLKQMYGAPHGDRGFADSVVAMEGDKIVVANFDEFQFAGGVVVPNSDGAFGEGYADAEKGLSSKKANTEAYSKNMAEKAGSTVSILDNYSAIEAFVAGKTVEEIEKVIADSEPGTPIDAVSGATLADTAGYLQLIVDTAKAE